MNNNANLHRAKKAKNDCFYTRYEDIEKEIQHYAEYLEGKWVYCPFDTENSNFWKYFVNNFHNLKLKHLTATSWNEDNPDGKGHRLDYDGTTVTDTVLEGNGSYDSPECTAIKTACDIIISNPPFSKFRSVIKWLQQ